MDAASKKVTERIIAAILSAVLPGAGQVYRGKSAQGLLWFFGVVAGYILILPGMVLHLLCIIAAAVEN